MTDQEFTLLVEQLKRIEAKLESFPCASHLERLTKLEAQLVSHCKAENEKRLGRDLTTKIWNVVLASILVLLAIIEAIKKWG